MANDLPVGPSISPQASPQSVGAFISLPDDRKRDVLSKLSPNAKRGLLQGIKIHKAAAAAMTIPGERKPEESPTPLSRFSEVTTGVPHPFDELIGTDIPALVNRPGALLKHAGQSLYQAPAQFANDLLTHPIDTLVAVTGGHQFGEDVHAGRYGSAVSDIGAGLINAYLLYEGGKHLPAQAEAIAKVTGPATEAAKAKLFGRTVRNFAGAGDFNVEDAAQKLASGNSDKLAGYVEKVQGKIADIDHENRMARQDHAERVQETQAANKKLREAIDTGIKADEASKAASIVVSNGLDDLERAATAKARVAYPKITGTADAGEVHADMQKIVKDKLRGAGNVPASLAGVLDQTSVEGSKPPQVQGHTLDLTNADDLKVYQRLKDTGVFSTDAAKTLSADDLHGMASEMGRELYSHDLPGDSRAALTAGRISILERLKQMHAAEGKLPQFESAQHGWRILENTFRNTDPAAAGGSPLAKALKARDPVSGDLRPDFVRQALTDDKSYKTAQQLLSRYPEAKDLQASLQIMKEQAEAAKSAPGTKVLSRIKPIPSTPKPIIKGLPESPEFGTFDAHQWVEQKLSDYAKGGYRSAQQYRPYRLPYAIIDKIMQSMARDPEFRKIVSQRVKPPNVPRFK